MRISKKVFFSLIALMLFSACAKYEYKPVSEKEQPATIDFSVGTKWYPNILGDQVMSVSYSGNAENVAVVAAINSVLVDPKKINPQIVDNKIRLSPGPTELAFDAALGSIRGMVKGSVNVVPGEHYKLGIDSDMLWLTTSNGARALEIKLKTSTYFTPTPH